MASRRCRFATGNVYGPRQDPLGKAGVIAIFGGKLVEGGRPTVFGDGLQTRDYTYVRDVVAANLAAVASDVTGEYNIGTGRETTVVELVRRSAASPAARSRPSVAPERPARCATSRSTRRRRRRSSAGRRASEIEEGLAQTLSSWR